MDNQRLKKFANDENTKSVLYDFLIESFLNEKSQDVYILASSTIAVQKLKRAWAELNLLKNKIDDNDGRSGNVGL